MSDTLFYGLVCVTFGKHIGRIGYYDDDDQLSSDEYVPRDLRGHKGWFIIEDLNDGIEYLDVATVTFGHPRLARRYHDFPFDRVRNATTADLIARVQILYNDLGMLGPSMGFEKRFNLMCELNLIDTTLLDRMINARTPSNSGLKIFISHSSRDKEIAKWISVDLANNGHQPWLDEWSIKVGESIPTKVAEGLESADFVLVLLSKSSVESKWVEKEWQTKYWDEIGENEILVLPVLIEDCEIPALLKTKKYADFRDGFSDGFRELTDALTVLQSDAPRKYGT